MLKQCSQRNKKITSALGRKNGVLFEKKTFLFSIAINSSRHLLLSQLCRDASVAGVVGPIQWVVPSPKLLQREEQGAFIDLIQGLRGSEEGVYRVFARVSSSTFDWLLELIKSTITKQHAVFLWSISP